jgi:hypothetical protein
VPTDGEPLERRTTGGAASSSDAPLLEPEPLLEPDPLLDAGRLTGLLADPVRLRVVAALVLGASTAAEVMRATGLPARQAGAALARLVEADLVVRSDDGTHVLLEAAFAHAARAAAPRRGPTGEHDDEPEEAARVLRVFVRNGRLTQIPTQRSKRLVVLDRLSQEFEPGRRYSERTVNAVLGRWHSDTAALRRYLVDEQLLTREHGEYWRSGGTVVVE